MYSVSHINSQDKNYQTIKLHELKSIFKINEYSYMTVCTSINECSTAVASCTGIIKREKADKDWGIYSPPNSFPHPLR